MKRKIWVTHEFEGFHFWKYAPEKTKFLRNLHRHIFKVKLTLEVLHNDREVEFFDLKDKLINVCKEYISKNPNNLKSCEMIGEYILDKFEDEYKDRKILVDVSEDGENGAVVEC